MSMYEMPFISTPEEEARMEQQQKEMLAEFQKLSVSTRILQQQESKKIQQLRLLQTRQQQCLSSGSLFNQRTTNNMYSKPLLAAKLDVWLSSPAAEHTLSTVTSECIPYSPYGGDYFSTLASAKAKAISADTAISSSYSTDSYNEQRRSNSDSSMTAQRTPSMTSASSSISSRDETILEDEKSLQEINKRDQYGFKRPVQWVTPHQLNKFDEMYEKILKKQTKRWNKLLEVNDQQWPEPCPQLTRYVREGIPQKLRIKAWMHYSGADKKIQQNPGKYHALLQTALESQPEGTPLNEHANSIKRDLHRTFPDNSFFTNYPLQNSTSATSLEEQNPKSLQQALYHVLSAFSIYSPDIGYCQSLNFLTGFLLLLLHHSKADDNDDVQEKNEEAAFWMLVTIVHDYFPAHIFDTSMTGANIEQMVLMNLVYENMPGVWSKIAGGQRCFWECEQTDSLPPVTLVTNHWFMTMFINILPVETVLRIWDCFFIEGFQVLYQVSLALLKLNEQNIWDLKDSVDTIPILQNMPRRLIDCHELMKSVFSASGVAVDLSVHEINRKRRQFTCRKNQRTKEAWKSLNINRQ